MAFLALGAAALALAPTPAGAQEAPLGREELTRFARAHVAMGAAREEFHAQLARTHDDLGIARARQELEARIAQILVENRLTSERHGIITLIVSQDEAVRAVFEEISRQLSGG
ncbi:MAG TPA: DUF4168 domain-containing protein [Longimicrobiales bacterium]|nr:DUF4168 domain-containing protein [Longimicrobiales bacterium]